MLNAQVGRRLGVLAMCVAATLGVVGAAMGQERGPALAMGETGWADRIWSAASSGDRDGFLRLLEAAPEDAEAGALRSGFDLLRQNIERREATRAAKIEEIRGKLEAALAEPPSDLALSKALRDAVELEMYIGDKGQFRSDPRVVDLVARAESAARAAEARGDWLIANELFYRLDLIDEDAAAYKEDFDRVSRRLMMISLYAPRQLWEMRSERRVAEGEEPLPAYNPLGDDYRRKLMGVTSELTTEALYRSVREHYSQPDARDVLSGGLEALRTFATTSDLAVEFPGLADAEAVGRFIGALEKRREDLRSFRLSKPALRLFVEEVSRTGELIGVPEQVVMHEFGNGAMATLDEFSAIIWPDEFRQFQRSTQGRFIGIGVQIRLNELSNIEVVTPLEGTPAQRIGIRSGDVIVGVNGQTAIGMSLDQAVDVITGPANTNVTITVEREEEGEKRLIDFTISRAEIKLRSVKGWQRLDEHEDHWNWFVDREQGIGYVRMTQFHEDTKNEFDAAIRQMKSEGLRGLILDLRFNPGGLLDQAIEVASRFVDGSEAADTPLKGVVVKTLGGDRRREQTERAIWNRASLSGIPVVVLTNEGSASASEIVSGAIQDYARLGQIKGLVLGARTYGKGSVQNVWYLDAREPAALKLTTAHYYLPGGRHIHKAPGRRDYGVAPDMEIEMLPEQITEAIRLRQDADVMPIGPDGKIVEDVEPTDPQDLIEKGIDLQLQTALVLLQSQVEAVSERAVRR